MDLWKEGILMKKNTLLTIAFILLFIISFFLGFHIRNRYKDTMIVPGHMTHADEHHTHGSEAHHAPGSHNGDDAEEDEALARSDLDFMHIKILNHPWNNPGIIEGMFFKGILYILMGAVLYIKLFKNE